MINFIFKIYLFNKKNPPLKVMQDEPYRSASDLPVFTILLPLYKEGSDVLKELFKNISNIAYPKEKLDIKILLEEEDTETIKNIPSNLPSCFEIVIVPHASPKTKAKACNYGLYFAKGEFVVIYDAEDKPDKNQLLRAIFDFNENESDVICVQGLLNFYNKDQNLLTKCFALEYLMWFNYFLPSLSALNLFIPLGGTSNHFRTKELIKIGGWDSFNVTEDAELGVRIAKNNFKTVVMPSYTMEEAPFQLRNWFWQRVRWIKGYIQTFIVHILDFKGNVKFGVFNTCNLFLSIGFSFLSFFLIPLIMLFSIFIKFTDLLYILMILNIICIFIYAIMFMKITFKDHDLLGGGFKYVSLFMPFYFILHIAASLVAFFEIFIKPFYWHKTKHGS